MKFKNKKFSGLCKSGYHGPFCKLRCSAGLYGPGCLKRCACEPGVSCDPETGHCEPKCKPGYTGDECRHRKPIDRFFQMYFSKKFFSACPLGRFGINCANACNCPPKQSCHPATGACSCPLGLMGDQCDESKNLENDFFGFKIFGLGCPPDRYGPMCSRECLCKNGGSCNPNDGSCSCAAGFYGAACTESMRLIF